MKKNIVLISCILIYSFSNAQDYQTGLGLRIGNYNSGFTIKHFISESVALEGIAFLFTRGDGVEFTGLYEQHYPFPNVEGLNCFIGFGAHVGFWKNYWYKHRWENYYVNNDYRLVLGADAVIGMEYTIPQIPINVAIDWHPFFNIIPDLELWPDRIGVSVRYTIN